MVVHMRDVLAIPGNCVSVCYFAFIVVSLQAGPFAAARGLGPPPLSPIKEPVCRLDNGVTAQGALICD